MSETDETTQQSQPAPVTAEARKLFVIRWLCAGAPSAYSRLDTNRHTVGRHGGCGTTLAASGVSREHAILTRQGPVYSIADNGSTNGTYVNGRRIRHAALAVNDVLRLGKMLGVVLRVPADLDLDAADLIEFPDSLFGPGLRGEVATLRKGAATTLPVVLVGETGVGKERFARVLHALSARPGPFHAVNCAALPSSLAEAELFGHRKGSFTGAEQAGLGHLRAAHRGTLLLDELADLAAPIQAKLLRVLQESEVTPLGETTPLALDLRVVAACQRPLTELVQAGRLREDLMMRLSGITLTIPPLRERRADIALLLRHLLAQYGGERAPEIEVGALEQMLLYAWPGNARELTLLVRNLLALHHAEPALQRDMLPESMQSKPEAPPREEERTGPRSRGQHDLDRLVEELKTNGGIVAAAASAAGISRQRAYRLMAGRTVEELLAPPPAARETEG